MIRGTLSCCCLSHAVPWGMESRSTHAQKLRLSADIFFRLTLTAASRAYLMEPQWNPAIEEQALARIHRLGQTKEVTTIRFVIDNSIEKVRICCSFFLFELHRLCASLILHSQYVLDVKDSKRDLISLLFTGNGSRCSQVTRAKLQVCSTSYGVVA